MPPPEGGRTEILMLQQLITYNDYLYHRKNDKLDNQSTSEDKSETINRYYNENKFEKEHINLNNSNNN